MTYKLNPEVSKIKSPVVLQIKVERFIAENGFHIKLRYGAFPSRPYDSKAIWETVPKLMKS